MARRMAPAWHMIQIKEQIRITMLSGIADPDRKIRVTIVCNSLDFLAFDGECANGRVG